MSTALTRTIPHVDPSNEDVFTAPPFPQVQMYHHSLLHICITGNTDTRRQARVLIANLLLSFWAIAWITKCCLAVTIFVGYILLVLLYSNIVFSCTTRQTTVLSPATPSLSTHPCASSSGDKWSRGLWSSIEHLWIAPRHRNHTFCSQVRTMLRHIPRRFNSTKSMHQSILCCGMPLTPRRLGSASKHIMVHPHKLFTDSYPPAPPPTLKSRHPPPYLLARP